mmetsp:Transcript_28391/g.65838  ORF Transcript_28391/g.65838 Transcript_28391/m.65838 type:complete len:89 (+) Transcript_28391:1001-1267(+)
MPARAANPLLLLLLLPHASHAESLPPRVPELADSRLLRDGLPIDVGKWMNSPVGRTDIAGLVSMDEMLVLLLPVPLGWISIYKLRSMA